jgi:hypothetical protein
MSKILENIRDWWDGADIEGIVVRSMLCTFITLSVIAVVVMLGVIYYDVTDKDINSGGCDCQCKSTVPVIIPVPMGR